MAGQHLPGLAVVCASQRTRKGVPSSRGVCSKTHVAPLAGPWLPMLQQPAVAITTVYVDGHVGGRESCWIAAHFVEQYQTGALPAG